MSENGVDWRRLCWHLLAAQRILLDGLAREAAVLQEEEERSIGGKGKMGMGRIRSRSRFGIRWLALMMLMRRIWNS